MPTDRLPHSYQEMVEAKNLIFPPVTFQRGKDFVPRSSDVIITPWSKSGTTWLQQIVHSLRSAGDMSFDDISRVSPWIEVADALRIDLDRDQLARVGLTFQDVTGLAARCSAGVQHPGTSSHRQQRCSQLGSGVLH